MQTTTRLVQLNNYMNDENDNIKEDNISKKKKVISKKVVMDLKSEELLKEALRKVVKEKIKAREVDDEVEAMVSTCSEFLKSFIIMGYDFEGQSIKPIFYAKNDADADALMHYLQKYFMTGYM
jgi:hypothetical protein|tara:strand:- start:175 stop:543 length:369 start_codon:yes stop_codon:yes gene_type:complete